MSEMNETDEKATANAEIDPSIVEGVVGDTWNTYLGAAVEPRGGPATETDESQVEARILISGVADWEVTLRGSWKSAKEATRRMVESSNDVDGGGGADVDNPECVLDAWGELANTLAGNLKASLGVATDHLSIPEVFRDPPLPAAPQDATELWFGWDGYLAIVRIVKIKL